MSESHVMKTIYTYGGQPAQRHLTVQCLLDFQVARRVSKAPGVIYLADASGHL